MRVAACTLLLGLAVCVAWVPPAQAKPPPAKSKKAKKKRKEKKTLVRLTVYPPATSVKVDEGKWRPVRRETVRVWLSPGMHRVTVRNSDCCLAETVLVNVGTRYQDLRVRLPYAPAYVTPVCDRKGALVKVNGRIAMLGRKYTIPIERREGRETLNVTFVSDSFVNEHEVLVGAAEERIVTCRPPNRSP